MNNENETIIAVLIATSCGRIESLFDIALTSVLCQTKKPKCIVIVDDNNDEKYSLEIEKRLTRYSDDSIVYLKNSHAKNMSGTGAWNTGIEYLCSTIGDNNFVAILDDDDSWQPNYIESLQNSISTHKLLDAVFAFIRYSQWNDVRSFKIEDLTVERFLIGDPGIQGSNMCFRLNCLKEIGGFDENLASCTDRDLMIRFLQKYSSENVCIIPMPLVNYNIGINTVTSSFKKKTAGLDYFYKKYIQLFNEETLSQSLKRANKLFKYPYLDRVWALYDDNCRRNKTSIDEQIIAIGVAIHNNSATIRRCLLSILNQKNLKRKLSVILANDKSTDMWQDQVKDLLVDERIVLINLDFQNVVRTRNAINAFIKDKMTNVAFIGRLDADDEYSNTDSLSEIEQVFDKEKCDIVLAGNYLRQNDTVIARINPAVKELSDTSYLLSRLKQMSNSEPQGELPSCNLFVRPKYILPYPNIASGEDHALLVQYLMNQDKYHIYFAENLLPVIYNLEGNASSQNSISKVYIKCRTELYNNTLALCKTKKESKLR
ncbi:MAG: glycosyltransferase family 2 protein [Bacteroidales bacterium]|nr:glycosyltransferase family 2 protein [Bacteroidales bacterium]